MANEQLSAALQDYLEAILALTHETGEARAGDIAARLGVHKSTVTAALRALSDKGLIHYAPYEAVSLTGGGSSIAREVSRSHEILRGFLQDVLLVEPGLAETNACRMEHVMDRCVLDRLLALADYMQQAGAADRSPRDDFAARMEGEHLTCHAGGSVVVPPACFQVQTE